MVLVLFSLSLVSGWVVGARKWSTSGGNDPQLKSCPIWLRTGAEKTIRHFPDKLRDRRRRDGRTHVFVYLVNRPTPVDSVPSYTVTPSC